MLTSANGAETSKLNEHLEPFRPLLGKTWKGDLKEPGNDTVHTDVARWEHVLNGEAVRTLHRHSVDDGAYGGETVIIWDATQKKLIYFYFTTVGFRTTGFFTFEGTKFVAEEEVTGSAQGVTKVRSTGEIREVGSMVNKSEHLEDGDWVPGHDQVYWEDPKAEVKFR